MPTIGTVAQLVPTNREAINFINTRCLRALLRTFIL